MRDPNGGYYYTIGQNIGIIDDVSDEDSYINWYKLIYMEPDNELPIGWLYLASEDPKKNIHSHQAGFLYAEMRESINPKLVVED